MHRSGRPRLFQWRSPCRRCVFTRVTFRQYLFAVLQQRQFRQRFFHFSLPWGTRIALQKFFIGFLRLRGLRKLIALQPCDAQQGFLAIFVLRIFADEKFVGIHRRLVITASEAVAHLGVKFRNRQQGIWDFLRARGNQRHAAVTHHRLLVIRERSLLTWFRIERGALLFGSGELRGSGLAFYGGGRLC